MRTITPTTAPTMITLHIPAGRVMATADPAATAATITLAARRSGDVGAERAIAAAVVAEHHARLSVTVHSSHNTGELHLDDPSGSIRITGGSVVAGNIGGTGNIGVVAGTGRRGGAAAGIDATLTVPAGTAIRVVTTSARVVARGPLAAVEVDH